MIEKWRNLQFQYVMTACNLLIIEIIFSESINNLLTLLDKKNYEFVHFQLISYWNLVCM